MREMKLLTVLVALQVCLLAGIASVGLQADGTETLGLPSVPVAAGSGMVAAGTGLISQPGTITIDIPANATVKQALLYWQGHHRSNGGDDMVVVDSQQVTGTLVGGPTIFFDDVKCSSYRADITSRALLSPGTNTLVVEGLSFDYANNGAGVLVIYEDGSTSDIQLRDGQDLAFGEFAPRLDVTAWQTFTFTQASVPRTAHLHLFFSSVCGEVSGSCPRSTVIEITVDGTPTETLVNQLNSSDGDEWDTWTHDVPIPAGATTLSVRALSEDRDGTGLPLASLAWIAAGLSLPSRCDECCFAWATEVVTHSQGTLVGSKDPITKPHRMDPRAALGPPDSDTSQDETFYSLGFRSNDDGWLVVRFGGRILNGPGADIMVKEATWNRDGYPMEEAAVYVIVDGKMYPDPVGRATSEPGGDGLVYIELPDDVPYADEVKLVDATDRGLFPPDSTADGYDVDAVAACICAERAVATEVLTYSQGTRLDGEPIPLDRSDPSAALGEIDGEFFSLGFKSNSGGYIIVDFGKQIPNAPGVDIRVKEVTENRDGYPEEKAKVYVIADGKECLVGSATSKTGVGGLAILDIPDPPDGPPYIDAVKLEDVTDPDPFRPRYLDADGYDVDAIIICGEEP